MFFHTYMHVNQGARRAPQGAQPPVQANPKLPTTERKQFKGKLISIIDFLVSCSLSLVREPD